MRTASLRVSQQPRLVPLDRRLSRGVAPTRPCRALPLPPSATAHFSSRDSLDETSGLVGRKAALSRALPPPTPAPGAALLDSLASVFRSSPHDGAIFSLALPAVLALAADPLLQVVDTVFVGQGGPDALAALGVNSALFTFSFVVFNFLATATTPLVAGALAGGDRRRAGAVTTQAMVLGSILGAFLAAALVLGADQALILMGADPTASPEMFSLAKDFLLVRAFAAPAVMIMTVGQGVFRGLQDMRTPMSITLIANAINLGLDVLLILGLGYGVKGAATATTCAEWIAAAAYLGFLWRRRDELGGAEAAAEAINPSSLGAAAAEAAPFLSAGGAVLMRTALLLGTKTLASATATRLGPVPIASHQVVMQLWLLSSLIIDSVAVAGQTLVAVEKGRGDIPRAREVSNRLLQLGIGGGAALAAAFWAAEPLIPGVFTNDAAVAATVASILPIAVAMLPINAAVYVLDGVLVGASDFKWMAGAMVVAAAAAVGLLVGVEPLDLGLYGVWGALAVLMTGRLATLVWRYQAADGPLPPNAPMPARRSAAAVPALGASGSSTSTSTSSNAVSASASAVSSPAGGGGSGKTVKGVRAAVRLAELRDTEPNVRPVKPSMQQRRKGVKTRKQEHRR